MVWFQFYQYIFIGTHTQRLERRGETRKAAGREAKSRKTVEKENEGEGGKPGRGPAVFRLLWVSRTPTTSRGAQRGNKARAPRLGDLGEAAPRSCRGRLPGPRATQPTRLHPPPASPHPPHAPSHLLLVHPGRASASRQSRTAPTPPGMVAAAPRALRVHKHAAMPAPRPGGGASGTHCSPSASQPRSQPSAATLRPQLRRAPPRGGGGDAPARRGGGAGGTAGKEPGGTPGSRVGSGDGEQRRESPSPRRGRLHGGRGLGRVGGSGF